MRTGGTMRAIQTTYAGCLFRSRLEARWAVFFDTLGIEWQYEPQGFEMTDGDRYLPDFWLPAQQVWFEVKGSKPSDDDSWWTFAGDLYDPVADGRVRTALAWGDIPDPRTVRYDGPPTWNKTGGAASHDIIVLADQDYAWCRCTRCGSFDIQHEAKSERNYCRCLRDANKIRTGDDAAILAAYAKARSARFEYDHRESW